jgi:hypothetical protein
MGRASSEKPTQFISFSDKMVVRSADAQIGTLMQLDRSHAEPDRLHHAVIRPRPSITRSLM